MRRSMKDDFSLHENYRDEEPLKVGSDRAFGCTVGTIFLLLGAVRALVAETIPPIAYAPFVMGVALLLVGVFAPSYLSKLNRLWVTIGVTIAKLVNPIILALLFFLVVAPMALFMRIVGRRPLRLLPDRTAATYWIEREVPAEGASSMRRQF